MKKLITACMIFIFAITGKVSAQGQQALQNGVATIILDAASLKDGQNSMLIKEGKGILQFTKNGDRFTNVSFKDSAGVVRRLTPVPAGTQGAPKPECKYPLPDACFGTADKNIGLCICKPGDISGGYTISFIRKLPGRPKYPNIVLKGS
ncbi:MAG: hypothetical protein ABIO79_11395 [Ferruginibacter sp.]